MNVCIMRTGCVFQMSFRHTEGILLFRDETGKTFAAKASVFSFYTISVLILI